MKKLSRRALLKMAAALSVAGVLPWKPSELEADEVLVVDSVLDSDSELSLSHSIFGEPYISNPPIDLTYDDYIIDFTEDE